AGCPGINVNYSTTATGNCWSNWQVRSINLTPFTGSCITVEVISHDCAYGEHSGVLLFDAATPYQYNTCCWPQQQNALPQVAYCAGSSLAQLSAPVGFFTYTWVAPPMAPPIITQQTNLSILTVTNPVVNSVYTVNLTSYMGCIYTATVGIFPSTVSIVGGYTVPSCVGGNSGNAAISAAGSGSGYNYLWSSTSNSNISTTYSVGGLSAGVYSVQVSAVNAPSCGVAVTTVAITQTTGLISVLKQFCGNKAYFNVPGGSNYQWYSGTVAIPASQGGTSSTFTVNNATQGDVYYLRYYSGQNCNDSIAYTLVNIAPGAIKVSSLNIICAGANNGLSVVSITPTIGAPTGNNYLFAGNVSSLSLPYSYSINPTGLTSFTLSNLTANAIYSINAFDGSCAYSTTFTPNSIPAFNFSLSPGNVTLCPGNQLAAGCTFSTNPSPGQYTYSWSPNLFLAGANTNLQNTILSPSVSSGGSLTVIYTVVATPSIANCPLSKTLALTIFNPATPSISSIPAICKNALSQTISVNPTGGVFSCNTAGAINSISGMITPSLSLPGINTFTYAITAGTCVAKNTGTFMVNAVSVGVGAGTICAGQSATLVAVGAPSYSWSTGLTSPSLIVAPLTSTGYTVTGFDSANSCTTTAVFNVSVKPVPSLNLPATFTCCYGSPYSFSLNAANSYSWSNGYLGPVFSFTANTSGSIAVQAVSSTGCVNSASMSVVVHPAATVVSNQNVSMCYGTLTLLKAFGATTYIWSNGVMADSVYINPMANTIYTVTGINQYGCGKQAAINVNVLTSPTVQINGKTTVCIGNEVTLTASGAEVYNWSNGEKTAVIKVSPGKDENYVVTGSNTNGCAQKASIYLSVFGYPQLELLGKNTLCKGDTLTLSADGALDYTWNTGETGPVIKVSPESSTYFSVDGYNAGGCVSEKLLLVTVFDCDSLNINDVWNLYPNPNNGVFYISTNTPANAIIYSAHGALVYRRELEAGVNSMDITNLSGGFYFVKLSSPNRVMIIPLLKPN
ncbi:MAG: T9SS type A sorting domain-containing protein, partial [Bacteroidia bacterium]|nr:T9SS type A sorting domain-containing protein [Bacteroidia bacterium]